MDTTFDHNKESLKDALNFDDKDMEQVTVKLAKLSHIIITKGPKQSELCEEIAKTFSYNELLFVATMFVTDKTTMILEQNPIVAQVLKFREMLDNLRKEE